MTNRGTFLAEPILSDRPQRTWFQGVNEAINRELFEIKIKEGDLVIVLVRRARARERKRI